MKTIGEITVALIVSFILSIINGYVFCKLWEWLVIPIFGFDKLTLVQSIGLLFVITFFTLKRKKDKSENTDEFSYQIAERLAYNIIYGILFLFFGWFISLFM